LLGKYLIRFFVPDHEHPDRPEVRTRLAYLAAWVSIIGNVLLAAVKIALGLMLNSISLLADAAHTASDVLTSIVVVIGFRAAAKPADRSHPFGHGRAETVAGLVIAVLLAVTAFEFIKDSFARLLNPPGLAVSFSFGPVVLSSWWAVAIMLLFALLKESMARFADTIGRNINSETVKADAWHHRSDAIASLLVVFALVGSRFGIQRLDAVFGLLVAVFIGYVAFSIGLSSSTTLLGKAAPTAFQDEIRRLAMTDTGVLGVHGVTVPQYGTHRAIGVHIETPPDVPVLEAHEVASRVEERLSRELDASVVVHVEPAHHQLPLPLHGRVDAAIDAAVSEIPSVVGFHGVHIHEHAGTGHVDLHVTMDGSQELLVAHEIAHQLASRIEAALPGFVVNVHIEPLDSQVPTAKKRLQDRSDSP